MTKKFPENIQQNNQGFQTTYSRGNYNKYFFLDFNARFFKKLQNEFTFIVLLKKVPKLTLAMIP